MDNTATTDTQNPKSSQAKQAESVRPLDFESSNDNRSLANDSLPIGDSLLIGWQQLFSNIKHNYIKTADNLFDEFLLTISQEQINTLLHTFVTKKVKMLHDLQLGLHDGQLRLSCTVNAAGLFASVASNFELVHIEANRHAQRLVLRQISDTEVIELHAKRWFLAPLAQFAVGAYRTILRKDPLPFILSNIVISGQPFTEHKGDVIYLEIGRWLKYSDLVMNALQKARINHGELKHEQLLLKVQPDFEGIFSFGNDGDEIISEKDNPNKAD
ncbi:hypothetical protein [Moraxella marmotae]|uniref:hypothetical protein n=1 Tax=Moraxella marmotae TaxID=3344520 RepID=UPI0035F25744